MSEHEINKNIDGITLGDLIVHIADLIGKYGIGASLKVIWGSESFKINIITQE